MTRKLVLTASLLLPLVAIAGVAHAEPATADKSYRSTEVRRDQADARRAYARAMPYVRAAPQLSTEQFATSCTYQGGPKSNAWTCR
jgi:hypothetical protein